MHDVLAAILKNQVKTLNLLEKHMASVAEFKALVLAKIDELKAASAAEHEQVLAVIKALQDQILSTVPDEYVTEVTAAFNESIGTVQAIYDPPTPT